ncbi:protein-export membrane protein SecD [Candidatus Roizmanbacteria bacterium RIFCSPLOWO2_12_FULL_40_12]|uniref:Protein translocase subunit SecD n=1 Tax=Candidatus Roizmanbacteria bacterium RIFCSPLOWO2_01_FULL_40_42 TaxID=1802066 RepID=A0A1F7J523_9BACT|nr:MAG: protein-export membrane protein SecD [Candidatus Roizmanbacteria bacterium RIFCSPHIGHO2_01_FULL_40_98]OGK29061.1 MAG: protein-export membrane protein SecD [Candidatus Roizmanbacteria bacterium RIFCSPHIGHO2_02_FULL_40_53]OGK29998.1 MAG: protein-export membrane protein SecD [Candidatus Roizmanbacteria bacterium RIFCSPHIGHO2_12_41_18]OGK36315.1 MAG: protein-export membrane protein SecD [Candidatus Roizmanbacteria bacterium RIFCSPHIGHO2_12_FULL_40_130]OGK50689.1 MAG: protein-export membrane
MDLPENTRVHFQVANRTVDFRVNPLSININLLGLHVQKDFRTHLGLDLQGGSHLVFQADTSKLKNEDVADALDSARDIIEKRVNFYGVSEPAIQTVKSGDKYRIVVDLPGITNVEEAVRLVGKTAQLTFREEAKDQIKAGTQSAPIIAFNPKSKLTGKDVKKATVSFNSQNGEPQVALSFSDNGAKLFGEITQANVGKQVGIFIDENILSAPVVQQPILDGNAVITGQFSLEEAKSLVIAINSGALPLPVQLVEQRNIGPSLGAVEIQKSVFAGIVGLIMVMLFMVLYYGRLGFIACLALIIYGLISLAIFRTIPVVLTLSGVAGFILSIGMAVDSNILIFERIKEELRKGRDFDIAIRLGFGRAIDAIKDANFTTLLVAFILFNPLNWEFFPQFGLVRGFALTLAIGVGTSLFTGVFITKHLIKFFYRHK